MSQPRFQIDAIPDRARSTASEVHRGALRPERLSGQAVVATWRFLGANNREIGRSASRFDEIASCYGAILALKEGLARVEQRLNAADARGQWSWSLWLEGEEVARSSRAFYRMRECRYNLEQFLAKVPDASVRYPSPTSASVTRRELWLRGHQVYGTTKELL